MIRFMRIFVETMCISWKKRRDISEAAMTTTLLLTFVKIKKRRNDPFEEISMYRNTSKTGMHILYHIKIDIMS